jgi:hypothetical protein
MVLIFKRLFVEKLSVGFFASMNTVNNSLKNASWKLVAELRHQPISLWKLLIILKKMLPETLIKKPAAAFRQQPIFLRFVPGSPFYHKMCSESHLWQVSFRGFSQHPMRDDHRIKSIQVRGGIKRRVSVSVSRITELVSNFIEINRELTLISTSYMTQQEASHRHTHKRPLCNFLDIKNIRLSILSPSASMKSKCIKQQKKNGEQHEVNSREENKWRCRHKTLN